MSQILIITTGQAEFNRHGKKPFIIIHVTSVLKRKSLWGMNIESLVHGVNSSICKTFFKLPFAISNNTYQT